MYRVLIWAEWYFVCGLIMFLALAMAVKMAIDNKFGKGALEAELKHWTKDPDHKWYQSAIIIILWPIMLGYRVCKIMIELTMNIAGIYDDEEEETE